MSSQPNVLRTIKVRSKENAIFTKQYNRCHVDIQPDSLQTDMANSYFAFKLSLKNASNVALEDVDYTNLAAAGYEITFGHQSFDYSPACLVKTAILKRLADGSIIESIPFSNIISQTLYQLSTSREQVQSQSLLHGSSSNNGSITTFSGVGSSLRRDKMEVQIRLQDVFQSLSSPNFWLSETGGLSVQLEFEDRADLFKLQMVDNRLNQIVPTTANITQGIYSTYPETLSTNFSQVAPSVRFPESSASGSNTQRNTQFRHIVYDSKTFELPFLKPTDVDIGANGLNPNQYINLKNQNATEQDLQDLGFKVGQAVRINWSLNTGSSLNVPPKMFSMLNQIKTVVPYQPATPDTPAVLSYTFDAAQLNAIAEWKTTAPSSQAIKDHYLQNSAAVGDFTTITINIDGTTGNYTSANITWKAGYVGATQKYIIPRRYLITPSGTGIAPVAGVDGDCTITVTGPGASAGDPPVFNTTGTASPVPSLAAGDPLAYAKIEFETMWYFDGLEGQVDFVDVEIIPAVILKGVTLPGVQEFYSNTLQVPEATHDALVAQGLLESNPGDFFLNLLVQPEYKQTGAQTPADLITAKKITLIAPDVQVNNVLASNQAVQIPNSGRRARIASIAPVAGTNDKLYRFEDLNMSELYGYTFKGVTRPSTTEPYVINTVAPTAYTVAFSMLNDSVSAINATTLAKIGTPLTYALDQFEVVLQQESKNMKMGMAKAFTTYRIEPFTIQDNVYQFEKQFSVMEQSTFNAALLSPEMGSLVSVNTDVYSYRYQINNIGNTTFDIQLRSLISDYPSSVHLDKMLDYFNNSPIQLANFFGIKGLENSSKTVQILPLKVYSSNDGTKYYTNTRQYTIQLLLSGNQTAQRPIKQGSYYLIKSSIGMI